MARFKVNAAAIIQARMGSTRLPGKVLLHLGGRSVLSAVIARAQRIEGVEAVCCTIPDSSENEPVAEEAARCGAEVFRGSESDVLSRYVGAARALQARTVMRITSDCPFLDWRVSQSVLERFERDALDYCSNLEPRSWPKGLDTEVMRVEALEEAAAEATDPADREHVTPYLRKDPFRRAGVVCAEGDFSAWRWTLDYPADMDFFRAALERTQTPLPSFEEIRAVIERAPDIALINAHLT